MATSQAPEWAYQSLLDSPTQQAFLTSPDPRFQAPSSGPPRPVDPSTPSPSQQSIYNQTVPPQAAAMSALPVQQPEFFNDHARLASTLSGVSSANTSSHENAFTYSSSQNLSHNPSASGMSAAAGPGSSQPNTLANNVIRSVSPLPLRKPLVISPQDEQVAFSAFRYGAPWEDWEKNKLVVYMVGPGALPGRLDVAMATRQNPRDKGYAAQLELEPTWAVVSTR